MLLNKKKIVCLLLPTLLLQGCFSYSFKELEYAENKASKPVLTSSVNVVAESNIFQPYSKTLAKESLSNTVSENNPDADIQVLVKKGKTKVSPHFSLGILNIIISGGSLFVLPAITNFTEPYEFVVVKDDKVVKTYHYETERDQFVWLFNLWTAKNKYWASNGGQFTSQNEMQINLAKKFAADLSEDESVLQILNNKPAEVVQPQNLISK